MKDKRPNVAAGRLGDISLGAGSSGSRGRTRDSYNTNRLGIVSEAGSPEPETQAPAPEPQDVPQAAPGPAARAWTPEPQSAPQPARAPWEDAPEAEEPFEEEEELSGWVGLARSWMPQTRRGVLAMGGGAACVVMSIVVLVWWFRDEPTGPEQAAAETPSAVVAQPVGAGTSRSTGEAARKRPRVIFANSTRRDDPAPRPRRFQPSRVPEVLKPPPSAPRPPMPTSRPAAATAAMPAPATPRRTETPTTKPATAAPPATPPGPPPPLRVSCVMKGPSGPAAIINGACVAVGDTLNGAKIIAIGQFAVEVEYTGHRYFIGVSAPGRSASAAAHEEDEADEEEEEEDEEDSDSEEE